MRPDILCIGSVLWDVVGRADRAMAVGQDVPGRIRRLPGGVAMNIAMTLRAMGLRPALLSSVGRDPAGEALLAKAEALGLMTVHVHRSANLPTDSYMAIEGENGLIAAIADAHSLEAAGAAILAPLADGRLGAAEAPWEGPVALDGNLTEALLAQIAGSPIFAAADLRVAPASPGKAERLIALRAHPSATLYVNLTEASTLCGVTFGDATTAAREMVARGTRRALVTDGAGVAACADGSDCLSRRPPDVPERRVTGAGDTFMAAHIRAELDGADAETALARALDTAAAYVAGEVPA